MRLVRYKFALRFLKEAELPLFAGNTVRGALGAALYRMGKPAYDRVFKVEITESTPNPYTISVPYPTKRHFQAGDTLVFSLTLFGNACEYISDFVTAAKDMCRDKLGNCGFDGYDLEYDEIWSDEGVESIPPCNEILIEFVTPTEIFEKKDVIAEISFESFIKNLFGRISSIFDNYTDGEFIIPYALIARKPFVTAKYNIKPIRFQTSGQHINGFIGTINYFGNVTRYLPYIDLGSQIHIGKKSTRSCGEYIFKI